MYRTETTKENKLTVYAVITYRDNAHFFIAGCFKVKKKAEKYCGDKLNISSFVKPLHVI